MANTGWEVIFVTCIFSISLANAGVREWYFRCCTKGVAKAKNYRGDFSVCEKDDLDRRRFPTTMDRMICRMAERTCCTKTLQTVSCDQGQYEAFQGKTCTRRHGYSGSDRFMRCCDCCALGIKTSRERGVSCTDITIDKDPLCSTVFKSCCNGQNITIQPGVHYTYPPPTRPPPVITTKPTPKAPSGCASFKCQHICREDFRKNPVCYCYDGYLIGDDIKTCVDVDECLRNPNPCRSENKKCVNTKGSYRCVASSVQPTPQRCSTGFTLEKGTCKDIDECASGASLCGSSSKCVNTIGSYKCESCGSGYRLRNNNCEDINECSEGRVRCGQGKECQNTQGSYRCVSSDGACSIGFRKQGGRCVDINECSERSVRCGQGKQCQNTIGSFKCVTSTTISCSSGYRRQGGRCVDIDECKEGRYSCRNYEICENLQGSYRCKRCPPGYQISSQRLSCIDINECILPSTHSCSADEVCQNTKGSFRCVARPSQACPSGYRRGSSGQCEDIDECREKRFFCNNDEECRNTQGSYQCVRRSCPAGFQRQGRQCVDIDECSTSNSCSPYANCINTRGSYSCTCKSGYQGDGKTCTATPGRCSRGFRNVRGRCVDIDECAEGTHSCVSGKTCQNTRGSYTCIKSLVCPSGYSRGSSGQCEDINECQYNVCSQDQTCKNLPGRYQCIDRTKPDPCAGRRCPRGYKCTVVIGNRYRCDDINECSKNPCDAVATCQNLPGSYRCRCPNGYRQSLYNKNKCQDVNECLYHVCEHDCKNTAGSYQCSCRSGFKLDSNSGKYCINIDECKTQNPCQGKCRDTQGSFECSCDVGYRLNLDRRTCSDFDECRNGNGRSCAHGCRNTPGSFTCTCRSGWKLAVNKYLCVDEDECQNDPNTCGGSPYVCLNTMGSHECANFPCPPRHEVSPSLTKYYSWENPNRKCTRVDCTDGDSACYGIKDKAFNLWNFNIPVGTQPADLFTYRIVLQGYKDDSRPVLKYTLKRGNEAGLFEVDIPTTLEGKAYVRNKNTLTKAGNYRLTFVGELFWTDGDLVSRYVHYLYVNVYKP